MSLDPTTVRAPDDVHTAISEYAEDAGVDEATAKRRIMQRGLKSYGYLDDRSLGEQAISYLGWALLLAAVSLLVATAPTEVNVLPTALPLAALGAVLLVAVRTAPTIRAWVDGLLGRGEPS